MEAPVIQDEQVKSLYETKYVKVFDLQYAEGKHYIDATRREKKDIIAVKSEEDFKTMLPDAATCIVIITDSVASPRLLLLYEYRYPAGRFLLSPPAGLIDEEDRDKPDALLITAKREIEEETGIRLTDEDRLFTVNPLVFSTPGMTDECNGLVCAVTKQERLSTLGQTSALGTECFNGFELLTKEEVRAIVRDGKDKFGHFYSLYTLTAMMYFLSGMWE